MSPREGSKVRKILEELTVGREMWIYVKCDTPSTLSMTHRVQGFAGKSTDDLDPWPHYKTFREVTEGLWRN